MQLLFILNEQAVSANMAVLYAIVVIGMTVLWISKLRR